MTPHNVKLPAKSDARVGERKPPQSKMCHRESFVLLEAMPEINIVGHLKQRPARKHGDKRDRPAYYYHRKGCLPKWAPPGFSEPRGFDGFFRYGALLKKAADLLLVRRW